MAIPLPLLATGRTAEIYAWDSDHVLKLFRTDMPQDAAQNEWQVARAVSAAGVAAPAVGDLVTVDGRIGLLYQRINGPTVVARLQSQPRRLFALAHLMADLHAQIHAIAAPALPNQHQRLAQKIETNTILSADVRLRLRTRLQVLPELNHLCHGDFHPMNVILHRSGPVAIDWTDATRGTPAADVARSILLAQLACSSAGFAERFFFSFFLLVYRRRYRQHDPEIDRSVALWMPIVAAARLREEVRGETLRLREFVLTALEKDVE